MIGTMHYLTTTFKSLLRPFLAIFTALVLGALLIALTGKDWLGAYIGLWEGCCGSPPALINTLVRSTPFVTSGLAVALSFQAGLFNVGAEGQLYVGALAAIVVGSGLQGLPSFIHVPLTLLAGGFGGLLWGAIPGFLKAKAGSHEVITTIMLNYIALRLTEWLIKSKEPYILGDPFDSSGERTRSVAQSALLPHFFNPDLHAGIILAGILVLLVYWLLYKTTIGFELRTVGKNPIAARYAGMNVPQTITLALALSGALAGLAGTSEVLGHGGVLEADFFAGLGFDSIAIALLARSNPLAVVASGLLWGALLTGARLMQVRAELSADLIKIVQALILLFVATDQIIQRLYRLRETKTSEKTAFSQGWGS